MVAGGLTALVDESSGAQAQKHVRPLEIKFINFRFGAILFFHVLEIGTISPLRVSMQVRAHTGVCAWEGVCMQVRSGGNCTTKPTI